MPTYRDMERSVQARCMAAGARLAKAWDEGGHGGPLSYWTLREFADWFEDLYEDIIDLMNESGVSDMMALIILSACDDILAQTAVTHDGHIKFIVRLRLWLSPYTEYDDWPCDITGMEAGTLIDEDSDIEEEETQFTMEDI